MTVRRDRMPVETALTEANLNPRIPSQTTLAQESHLELHVLILSPRQRNVNSSATTEVEEPVNVPARSARCAMFASHSAYSDYADSDFLGYLSQVSASVNGTKESGEVFCGEEIAECVEQF